MKKLSLVLLLVFAGIATVMAQRSVTGKVSDENGEGLIGATVLVVGTSTGTVTDLDGNFSISVPAGSTKLLFSYTGYAAQEVTLGASNVVDVTLQPDATLLSEIIVTGYSEQEAKKVIASVAVIDNKALENVPMPDVNQLIQGRAPGVLSTASSGQPGAQQDIRIRGTGSITAGRGPLYVIDGVIMDQGDLSQTAVSTDVLSNINPNDIESVNILKDAAATALYGSRGANGVVLITTKRGKAGKTELTAKVQYGTTSPNIGNFEMMTAEEAWNYERVMLANVGRTQAQIDAARPQSLLNQPSMDWVDAAFRNGTTQNLELQARGGNEKTRFFASAGYFNQEGTLIESKFSRLSLRSNIDHTASDKLDFSLNINGSYTDQLNAVAGNRFASPLLGAFVNTPLQPAINAATGEFYTGLEPEWLIFTNDNFLYSQPLNPVINNNLRLITKLQANYKITKNLRFTQVANLDFVGVTDYNFFDPLTNDGIDTNGQINNAFQESKSLTTQSLLKYFNTFGTNHNIDALAGYEFQRTDREAFFASGQGLASGKLKTLNSTAEPLSVSGSNTNYSFVSFFGQLNYNFKEKYFLTASARNDGSSRFGANNRFATFWSVGGSWILTEESFLANSSLFSNLRLRGSYGTSGNAAIGNFESLELYGFGAAYDGQPGSTPAQIANPDLTWELSKNANVGLDFGLLKGRLNGTVEVYRRIGTDLLLNVPVSRTSGFASATRNIGKIQNQGVEITLSGSPIQAKTRNGFNWNIDLNLSINRNKILELPGGEDILNGSQIYREGLPIRSMYMEVWAGVNPDNGQPQWETAEGITSTYSQAVRKIIGNAEPNYIAGMNNTFSVGNFSLTAFLYTAQGHEIYNNSRQFIESDGQRYGWNHLKVAGENYWTAPGDNALRPQPRLGGNRSANSRSTRYVEDASFIRLRNVQLTYSIPASALQKIGFGKVLLYVQGQNLWTQTNYSGFDPEASENGSEFFRYPVGKSLTFGADFTF